MAGDQDTAEEILEDEVDIASKQDKGANIPALSLPKPAEC